MKTTGSISDPLWFKDAIIYELHVRAFSDSNNDGIGDFSGLTQKLDYLVELGVTCLWLLPFFPSPLRDDGYDIADYTSVHPDYGTLADFQEFLDAAHERNLQVMVELVVNHTSDQHPWFQAARNAPPGSEMRNRYVWSDSDQTYPGVRIIFTDTEKSNWTWDPVAKAYYWHRFFSHQPDLNFDNPKVLAEILEVMNFWLDMGVDGLRLDAIPYLVEREGTNCENLPETHALIKEIRRAMDERYTGRMILAEANQWPTDVRAYFGDGDECHMAFHFPLMPRIFMALRLEDRMPITEILAQTPPIPENCQWGLFLRNHDELTLEMVSDEERDYMYLAYSADPRMRINVGIRRRLAPLMDHNRRRIELLYSLLLSFPGTPILYYGDEIGMGDNIYLGDRNGVRTPMQWSEDRNAGFSRVTPAKLYSPVIMDPAYGYQAVNVEAQRSDPSSLLNWMRNMIALRKLFGVFGRGSIEFLDLANRKVIAYLRRDATQVILCVANLSRFPQPVELDLRQFEGVRPIEMLGYVEFPLIGQRAYPLTLSSYGFLWFELPRLTEPHAPDAVVPVFRFALAEGWASVLEEGNREALEVRMLPRYLPRQRWFGGKSRRIRSTTVLDWGELPESCAAVVLAQVDYETGEPDTYLLTLATSFGAAAIAIHESSPQAILAEVTSAEGPGVLHEAVLNNTACDALLSCVEGARRLPMRRGELKGTPSSLYLKLRGPSDIALLPARGSVEQSNSSILYGDRFVLKLFRRQAAGPNPDCEIGAFLTERARFTNIPPFAGSIEYTDEAGDCFTLGLLQGFVPNEGDGWKWHMEELDRYFEEHVREPFPSGVELSHSIMQLSENPASSVASQHLGICLDSAAVLGKRTAEMHLALACETDDLAFTPESMEPAELSLLAEEFEQQAALTFEQLKAHLPQLPDEVVESAGLLLSRRKHWLNHFHKIRDIELRAGKIRIHGDYHLGQVLRSKNDYVIVDFEGEPVRSLLYRQAKQCPLKDVAGMLRSFSYAAHTAFTNHTARRPDDSDRLAPWVQLWELAVAGEFLRSYRFHCGSARFLPETYDGFEALLEAFVLDKALYELRYELDNRPAWVHIPLAGMNALGL